VDNNMTDHNDHNRLGNPFDHRQALIHGHHCDCQECRPATPTGRGVGDTPLVHEAMMDRVVESALVRGIFGHSDMHRRQFMKLVGGGKAAAAPEPAADRKLVNLTPKETHHG